MTTTPIAASPNDVTVRTQFEKWYAGDMPKGLERTADGEYKYMPAQVAWGVWQAATAAETPGSAPAPCQTIPHRARHCRRRGQ